MCKRRRRSGHPDSQNKKRPTAARPAKKSETAAHRDKQKLPRRDSLREESPALLSGQLALAWLVRGREDEKCKRSPPPAAFSGAHCGATGTRPPARRRAAPLVWPTPAGDASPAAAAGASGREDG
eukprot:scaffold1830_cov246-Pinguiococcus_pyrenoidosus.AAC.13